MPWEKEGSLNYQKGVVGEEDSFDIQLASDEINGEQLPSSSNQNEGETDQQTKSNTPNESYPKETQNNPTQPTYVEENLTNYQLTRDRQRRTIRPPARYEQADCIVEMS